MSAPTRPVLRWHGGKWMQAPFALLEALRALKGFVVLSGYPDPLYDEALCPDPLSIAVRNGSESPWSRVERAAYADGARPRTEVLWLNPACTAALANERGAFRQTDFLLEARA